MDAPDVCLAHFARDHHGVFAATHATGLGFTRARRADRVEAGLWIALYDDVYRLASAPVTWRGNLLAACWAGGFRAVGSHRSAAALSGIPGGRRHITEITCPRWRRARHDGLVVHESNALDPIDITMIDGIPATTPERTLVSLAADCSLSLLEVALDDAEHRNLVTAASMWATVERLAKRGRPGIRNLRALLESRNPVGGIPESVKETLLRQGLRARGLPEPVMQFEIRLGSQFVARVDAAYPEARIAIEYDSYEFHGGRLALVRDSERRTRLLAAGWRPFTATNVELENGCRTLGPAIAEVLRRAS